LRITIVGLGGQGVVSAARIFARAAALGDNKHVLCLPSFGWERRGGSVRADLVISAEPILLRSHIYNPDVVVFFDSNLINEHLLLAGDLEPETTYIVNTPDEIGSDFAPPGHPVFRLDARSIALSVLKLDIPNTAMLGAMAGVGLIELSSIRRAIVQVFGGRAGELNSYCAALGCQGLKNFQPGSGSSEQEAATVVPVVKSEAPVAGDERAGNTGRYYLGPCSLIFDGRPTGWRRSVRPRNRQDRCVACGVCQKHCPTGCITVSGTEDDERSGFSVQVDFCKGCGICYNLCPREAISMVPAQAVV